MKQSIKNKILLYLEEKRDWVWGGLLEDMIRQTEGAKASNASRRLRELAQSGLVEVRYVQVEGVGPKVCQYRIKKLPKVEQLVEVPMF